MVRFTQEEYDLLLQLKKVREKATIGGMVRDIVIEYAESIINSTNKHQISAEQLIQIETDDLVNKLVDSGFVSKELKK